MASHTALSHAPNAVRRAGSYNSELRKCGRFVKYRQMTGIDLVVPEQDSK